MVLDYKKLKEEYEQMKKRNRTRKRKQDPTVPKNHYDDSGLEDLIESLEQERKKKRENFWRYMKNRRKA